MFKLTKLEVNEIAKKTNFNRNSMEKVLRLYDILNFLNEGELKELLVLKGGTAINLFMLNLPRLSVDIDLDFNKDIGKEEMLEKRLVIDKLIKNFMQDEGYLLSDKSKFVHTLDSYVYSYVSTSGGKDILKIEINYSNRVHVLKPRDFQSTKMIDTRIVVNRLADEELIGSKVNAMILRTTPRDVYDVYNIFKNNDIKNVDLIKKIAIFYISLSSETPINLSSLIENCLNKITDLNFQRIKETLIPLLHKSIVFDVKDMSIFVADKIKEIFIFDQNDENYIEKFNNREFDPNKLFSGYDINNLVNHPMGIWKTKYLNMYTV